jgi:hypothetical protein
MVSAQFQTPAALSQYKQLLVRIMAVGRSVRYGEEKKFLAA